MRKLGAWFQASAGQLALAVYIIVAIACSLYLYPRGIDFQFANRCPFFLNDRWGTSDPIDFVVFYVLAKLAVQCRMHLVPIYNVHFFNDTLRAIVAPHPVSVELLPINPPYFGLLLSPLALLSLTQAFVLWTCLSLLAYGCSIRLLTSSALTWRELVCCGALGIVSFPSLLDLATGQTGFFLLFGTVAFWLLLEKRRYYAAGLAGITFLVKLQFLPPALVIGCFFGKWRFFAALTAVALALVGSSVIFLGWQNTLAYISTLAPENLRKHYAHITIDEMENFRAVFAFFTGQTGLLYSLLPYLMLCVAAPFLWKAMASLGGLPEARNFRLFAALFTLMLLAFSPHTHGYDYLAAVLSFIWIWAWLKEAPIVQSSYKGKLLRLTLLLIPYLKLISVAILLKLGIVHSSSQLSGFAALIEIFAQHTWFFISIVIFGLTLSMVTLKPAQSA